MNSENKLGAAPLIKARGVPTTKQNKSVQSGGDKVSSSTTMSTTTATNSSTTGRTQNNYASENLFCLRENGKCTRPRIEGQRYCLQHAKLDRDSVYCQCNYVSSRTGKRCFNITVKSDTGKEGYRPT